MSSTASGITRESHAETALSTASEIIVATVLKDRGIHKNSMITEMTEITKMTVRLNNPIHTTQGKSFKKIFGVPVMKFWDIRTGFDVIEFDRWLKTPDNISTKDWIEKKHGLPAVKVVKSLIGMRPFTIEE